MISKFLSVPTQIQQILLSQGTIMAKLEEIGTEVTALSELVKEAIGLLKQDTPDVHGATAKLEAADEKIQTVVTDLADVEASPPRITTPGPTGDAPAVPTTHVSEGSAS